VMYVFLDPVGHATFADSGKLGAIVAQVGFPQLTVFSEMDVSRVCGGSKIVKNQKNQKMLSRRRTALIGLLSSPYSPWTYVVCCTVCLDLKQPLFMALLAIHVTSEWFEISDEDTKSFHS
jgi:hypothetical protein